MRVGKLVSVASLCDSSGPQTVSLDSCLRLWKNWLTVIFVIWDMCHFSFTFTFIPFSLGARVWFDIPPYISSHLSHMWLLSHYTMGGGCSYLGDFAPTGIFGAQFLAHFVRGFVILHLLHILIIGLSPNFGSNWTPDFGLIWSSCRAWFGLSGGIWHPPSDPFPKKLS